MDEVTLLSLSTEELYRVFIAKERDLKEDGYIKDKDIAIVRYGKNISFSLAKYFQYKDSQVWGVFRRKPKSDLIKADKSGYVEMDKFNEELEARHGIMLNALLDYYSDDDDIIDRDLGSLGGNNGKRKK